LIFCYFYLNIHFKLRGSSLKKIVVILIVIFSFAAGSLYLHAEPSTLSELEQEQEKLEKEIDKLENSTADIDEEILENEDKSEELTAEIEKLQAQRDQIEKKEEEANKTLEEQQKVLAERFVVMYQNMDTSLNLFQLMLSSESIEDFMNKYQMMTFITGEDKKVLNNYKMAKKEVANAKKIKEDMINNNEDDIDELDEENSKLEESTKETDDEVSEIEKQLKVYDSLESDMLAESINIGTVLSRITSGEYVGGNMRWPVPTYKAMTSPYGYRIHPIYGDTRFHSGIDISANSGEAILAANAGKVIEAEYKSGYGNTIIVDHGGGYTTLYAHCSSLVSGVGDGVEAGKVIAKVGTTGSSTGNHLHFEVRINGATKDPMAYVSEP
jgi:murein DD-endopeptidase MepM/ murein hydrolase activator NlpD